MNLIIIMTLSVVLSYASTSNLEEIVNEPKIINGSIVSSDNKEWEFIVALQWKGEQYCGGSLISPHWILTAAHCLADSNGNVYPVQLDDTIGIGNYNLNNMTNYSVKNFIIHPLYNFDTSNNDIGLIELVSDVTQVPFIPYDVQHSLAVNTLTKVAGWGNMSITSKEYPLDLREALVPIIDTNTCNATSSYNGMVTNNMICAGYMDGRRDGCQGDSGGPLIIDNTLLGIVSWGYGCAKENYPGVYTKVQNYKQWIESYVSSEYKILWTPIMMGDIMTFIPMYK